MDEQYIGFGRYSGTPWTRLPISYLRKLANSGYGSGQAQARLELERRGLSVEDEDIEITLHAVDRASLKLIGRWKKEARGELGFASWIKKGAQEAIRQGQFVGNNRYVYNGVVYVVVSGHIVPSVVSVYPVNDEL